MMRSISSGGCSQNPPSMTTRILSCLRADLARIPVVALDSSCVVLFARDDSADGEQHVGLLDGQQPRRLALELVELAQAAVDSR